MAAKQQTQTLAPEVQQTIVQLVGTAIRGARQASGTIARMKSSGISFERDKTDPMALGVLGARKRHDEIISRIQSILVPMLDVENRVAVAKLLDERFARGPARD